MSLKLLHISDIHFKYFNGKEYLDRDLDIRNELEIDLKSMKEEIGSIDAILVGGDIAFGGKDNEYKIADQWLTKICSIAGCEEVNVLTVPGNHDIDRDEICSVVSTLQKEFKGYETREEIDGKLHDFLKSEPSYSILLKPLKAYHLFAQKYGSIPKENPLFWEKELNLDSYTLKIRGINSAIVSSKEDHINTSKLIVGSLQTTLLRDEKVIYLTLCHHPPDWLIDEEGVNTDLLARAKVHLFGHKHIFNSIQMDNSLRLTAGAMQPSRKENKWEPRYNIIGLEVQDSGKPSLKIEIWRRKWDGTKKQFVADFTTEGHQIHEYILPLKNERRKPVAKKKAGKAGAGKAKTKIKKSPKVVKRKFKVVEENIEVLDLNNPEPMRQLTYMFVALPYPKKMEAGISLSLLRESDADLDEIGIATVFLSRAEEMAILSQLWDKTVELQVEKTTKPNPFK